MMVKSTPKASSTRRTSASGTWVPPATADFHDDRSRRDASGCSIAAINMDLNISPGESDSRTHALVAIKKDSTLYSLSPHLHKRGSWMKFEALLPDGRREMLLSVPHYDFNWQTEYYLTEPKQLAAGTWILCTGGFDNSKMNPANPDPAKRVKWGEQSFEEMFVGFMNVANTPKSEATKEESSASGE